MTTAQIPTQEKCWRGPQKLIIGHSSSMCQVCTKTRNIYITPICSPASFSSLRNSNPNSMKDVCRFNSLRSGPTRPLLLMISGRASELSTRRSYHGSHPCRETSNFFPSCCLTVYKTFFSETFIFQEIIHLGKESKNYIIQIINETSTKKKENLFFQCIHCVRCNTFFDSIRLAKRGNSPF